MDNMEDSGFDSDNRSSLIEAENQTVRLAYVASNHFEFPLTV